MMRKGFLLLAFACATGLSAMAQNMLYPGFNHGAPYQQFRAGPVFADSSLLSKKWSLVPFAGINTGFQVWNGGNSSMVSAPVGLQLNRQLTRNLYAFGAISAAPTYFYTNSLFPSTAFGKNYQGFNTGRQNQFGIYSRAEAGLMYINSEKTFSISGSIGVSNYQSQPFGHPAMQFAKPQQAAIQRQ